MDFTPRLVAAPPAPRLVTVCAWCPDAAERTASARAHGCDVTHGMCPVCEARMNAELDAAEVKVAA